MNELDDSQKGLSNPELKDVDDKINEIVKRTETRINEEQKNVEENQSRVSSEIGEGKEPIETQPIVETSEEKVSPGGVYEKLTTEQKEQKLNSLFNLPLSEVTTDSTNRISSNFLNDVLKGDSVSPEGYSKLDIPTRLNVFSRVLGLIENDKVFDSIVPFISVDVVNNLASEQFPADMLLNDKSMFIRSLSVNASPNVVTSVIGAIKKASAINITEGFNADSGRGLKEISPTITTDNIIIPEIPSMFIHGDKGTKKIDAKQDTLQENKEITTPEVVTETKVTNEFDELSSINSMSPAKKVKAMKAFNEKYGDKVERITKIDSKFTSIVNKLESNNIIKKKC
jgi:hypothetical protein